VSPPLLSGSIAKRRRRERASSSPRRVWVAGLGWLGRLLGERLRARRLAQVLALVLGSESFLLGLIEGIKLKSRKGLPRAGVLEDKKRSGALRATIRLGWQMEDSAP
jgi:hypothetical protein